MLGGAELGQAVAMRPGDTEAALAVCEEKLFPRSVSEAADTHVILDLCLGDRGPFGFIDFLSGGADAPQ
jgi:hypothetical protein